MADVAIPWHPRRRVNQPKAPNPEPATVRLIEQLHAAVAELNREADRLEALQADDHSRGQR